MSSRTKCILANILDILVCGNWLEPKQALLVDISYCCIITLRYNSKYATIACIVPKRKMSGRGGRAQFSPSQISNSPSSKKMAMTDTENREHLAYLFQESKFFF